MQNVNSNDEIETDLLNSSETSVEPLKLLSLNVCGLLLKKGYPEFCDVIAEVDIVCLSETKLDELVLMVLPALLKRRSSCK